MIENNVFDSKPANEIFVSILVPVYGVESYIERCAHSLFQQTFTDIEYIFVNDCTQDNSILVLTDILSKYPNRLKNTHIIHHTINTGVAGSRETALQAAKGKFILFVDSDDYIELNMVELLYQKATDTNADIVICSFYNESASGKITEYKVKPLINKSELMQEIFVQPAFWNKFFRRELLTKHHIIFPKNINYGEDLSVTPLLIYYSSTIAFIEKPLYHYFIRQDGSYTFNFTKNHLEQTLHVVDELSIFFNSIPDSKTYKTSTITLKAIRKAKILRSNYIDSKYLNLYPEINNSIIKVNVDIKTKLILYLAKYRLKKILELIVRGKYNN